MRPECGRPPFPDLGPGTWSTGTGANGLPHRGSSKEQGQPWGKLSHHSPDGLLSEPYACPLLSRQGRGVERRAEGLIQGHLLRSGMEIPL